VLLLTARRSGAKFQLRSAANFKRVQFLPAIMKDRSYSVSTLAFMAAVAAFLAAFLVYPTIYIFSEAFWIDGHFSLAYFRNIFQNPPIRQSILNSILLGLTTTAATTLLAAPLAIVAVRYAFRGKGILTGLLLVPMIMPPFVGAVGMRRLLAREGSINVILQKLGIVSQGVDFLGTGGFWAVVLLEVLHLYPIMYLNVAAALANVDPSLEEAARNMGDSGLRLFRKITFPLMLPGYFAGAVLVFIWAFTDLGTPLIFDYQRVAAYKIYDAVNDLNTNPMAYALVVIVILLAATAFAAARFCFGGRGHEMVSKGTVAAREKPASRTASILICGGILLLAAVALLPHFGVFLTSITAKWSGTVFPTQITGEYYVRVFHNEFARTGVRNSLFLSFGSTLMDVLLGVGIAFILVRRRFQGSGLLDALAMMPLAVPGIVLAFGYVAGFSGTPLDPRRNPLPLLMIAYSVRRLPYMTRAAYAGFQQTSVTLEEAAMNVGASPARTLFKITLPLILGSLIAGAILTFTFAMLEVSESIMLAFQQQHYPLTKVIYQLQTMPAEGDFIASAMGVMAMVLLAATLLIAGALLGKRMGQLFRA
jgi:iron(III) transport system permease protein